MNACPSWKDRLLDHALDALDAREASQVEAHVEACPACARALAALRARRQEMDAALRGLGHAEGPPVGFRARLLQQRESAAARLPWRLAWAAVPAALVLIALATLFIRASGGGSPDIQRAEWVATRELVEWRSPTETLMRSPIEGLLRSGPRLGEAYMPLSANLPGGNR